MELDRETVEHLVKQALAEDIGRGDITSQSTIPPDKRSSAVIVAKAPGVLAGIRVARTVFEQLDPQLNFSEILSDGSEIEPGEDLARLTGSTRSILAGERVALNFLQHLSGIATLTEQFVRKVKKYPVKILDTRKTLPGLRLLEKYAVRMGGGDNHRMGLFDEILIKDNHIAAAGSIFKAVEAVRKVLGDKKSVEVEAKTLAEVEEALDAGADTILLDNMTVPTMKSAVKKVATWNKLHRRKVKTEASGGVTLASVGKIAATGVDMISVGALTHSAPALDISLDIE